MAGKHWINTYIMWEGEKVNHLDWLKKYSHLYTMDQICQILNRTENAVYRQIRNHGLTYRDQEQLLGDEEAIETIEGISIDSLLRFMKDKPRSLGDMSEQFDRSENTVRLVMEQLLEQSYAITRTEAGHHVWSTKIPPRIVAPPTTLWDNDVWEFKLGAMSDWHDGSKSAQISAKNRAIQIMYDEGVRDIIVAGDINAGNKVYKGQEVDNVSMRSDDQAAITERYCPRHEGLTYRIMGGNHDYSHIVHGGHDALKSLCRRREDFEWYGYDLATIRLTEDVDALVWHPQGGQAYAMSYKSQKMVEQLAFQQLMEVIKTNATPKVRFVFVGHWHNIFMWYSKGPINIVHTGGLEGQNNLTRRMGNIVPHITAIIISGEITKDRNIIRRLRIEPMNFTEIETDYLNYPVPQEESPKPEPMFQYTGSE